MQAQSVASPEAAIALQEAAARISGMRDLYENMLMAETHSEVRLDTYLGDIVESIVAFDWTSTPVTLGKQFDVFSMAAGLGLVSSVNGSHYPRPPNPGPHSE